MKKTDRWCCGWRVACRTAICAAVLALVGTAGAVSCDGTNVWIGAASGGSWSDVANWRAESAAGYTVEQLFQRYTVYDLRALGAGAVLTNDYAGGNAYNLRNSTGQTFVYGLVASGAAGDVWTVVPKAAGAIRFCDPSVIDIEGGLLDFRTPLAGGASYPTMNPTKRGTGAFRFGVPNTYLWEKAFKTEAGTTIFSNNSSLVAFKFTQANGGRLLVTGPGTSRVSCVSSSAGTAADATALIEIEAGATLDLSGGFNNFNASWYGDVAGAGDLRVSGGGDYLFGRGAKTAPLSLTGTYRLWNADLAFGTVAAPNPPSAAAALALDASGSARLFGDQTLRALSGTGTGGALVWPADRTLTVNGADETVRCSARLRGGAFVYDAPGGRLALEGDNVWTGATRIARGTLAVRLPVKTGGRLLPSPLAHWTFDAAVTDGSEVKFVDSGTNGWDLVSVPTNANGTLRHVTTGSYTDADGHVTRYAATTYANTALRLRSGVTMTDALADGSSFTVSLRTGRACDGVFLILGDGTTNGSVRLTHTGCPRYPAWLAGSSTSWGSSQGYINLTASPANWTHLTLVYDAAAKKLMRYVDGVCEATNTSVTVSLKPRDLVLAAKTLDSTTGVLGGFRQNIYLDDLRIYGAALDAEQVAALVRDVRGANATPRPIPSGSPVEVAAGATFVAEAGGEVALEKLVGAGTVEVEYGATFGCADLTGFTGRIVCYGTANLTDAQRQACERGDFTLDVVPTEFLNSRSPDYVFCTALSDATRFYSTLYTTDWGSYGAKDAYRITNGQRPFAYCSGSVTQAIGHVDLVTQADGSSLASWTMRPAQELPALNQFCVTLSLPVAEYTGGSGRVTVDGEVRQLTETVMSGKSFANPSHIEVRDRTGAVRLVIEPQQNCSLLVQDNRSGGWGETISLRFTVYKPDGGWVVGQDYVQGFKLSIPDTMLRTKPIAYDVITAGERWIPVAATYADSAEGGILDFSSFRTTRGDAGAYGRVVVRNGRFEFENLPGVAQRFFGANLTETAVAPDKATGARCCAQLRRMGYNAVRIHHHEKNLVAAGDDIAATNLSAVAMDKFDALVQACITNGLYLTTDLYVSRSPILWRAVGYDRDGELGSDDFKYLVYADERVFANLCDFTRNYFSHVNPYTGRSLAAEPAMLGINLINEGNKGYFASPSKLIADYPVWGPKWQAWLAAKKAAEPSVYGALSTEPPANLNSSAEGAAFAQFLRETEEDLFDRLKSLLRDELGCRAPLTNLNGGSDRTAAYFLPRADRYDYADYHRYIGHPSFLETSWSLPSKTSHANPLQDVRAGMPALLDLRIADKPMTITEWNYSGPARYRSMAGLFFGAEHALQDHDGIFRFAWSQGKQGVETPETKSTGYFDLVGDPLACASERVTALLFMRRDLQPLATSYVYRYPRAVASSPDLANKPGSSAAGYGWQWAGWFAKLSSVVGDTIPSGAVAAGVWPAAAKSAAEIWGDLGVTPPTGDDFPTAGDGQVSICTNVGSIAVSTARTAAFFTPGCELTAGPLAANVGDESATLCASSMDGMPLAMSSRVLFLHLTECLNTGMTFADETHQIVMKWGGRPVLMRAARATVELTFADGRSRTVWALAEDGTRRCRVPSVREGTKLRFVADVAVDPDCATYQYEIVPTASSGWCLQYW